MNINTFIAGSVLNRFKRFASMMLMVFGAFTAFAESSDFSYIPQIHGVFRGRWELETDGGYSHFQVRNARVSIDGYAAPILTYKFNVDLCDRGKIIMLDAYANITPVSKLNITVGQYRMPFGVESFRGPGGLYFNNRSYIGKHVNNYRAVGVSVGYTLPKLPLTLEGGAFNPTVIDDHSMWVKKYAYAAKLTYKPSSWIFATGFESLIPASVRINLASATIGWSHERFYVEGEYMARWYTHNAHSTTHAYNVFANYDFPLRKGLFDIWSVQARFDGMTDLASGTAFDPVKGGKLQTTAPGRKRLTLGTTLDYKYKSIRAAVRLNYEKCWFDHKSDISRGNGDMLSAELIVKF